MMKPWEVLGETNAPDGTPMRLMRRDREYVIFSGGDMLMSSRMYGSETALAALAWGRAKATAAPCVLVGGLGLGYTLRATLDLLPDDGVVVVAELMPAVVDWNRGVLGSLAGHPLDDRRTQVVIDDVGALLARSRSRFDVILLDVDNGPEAFVSPGNVGLYGDRGLAASWTALKPGGTLAVWSAFDDRRFARRLGQAGFSVEVKHVRARLERRGPRHTIYLANREA